MDLITDKAKIDEMMGVVHHFADDLYCKEIHVKAGYFVCKHMHSYSHLSVLAQGKALVTADGVAKEYTGPCVLEIKANVMHQVDAITDCVWLCIHATDEKDASKVDDVIVSKGV